MSLKSTTKKISLTDIKKITETKEYKDFSNIIEKRKADKNFPDQIILTANYRTAASVLDKQAYYKDNPEQLQVLKTYLEKYPEINVIVQTIITARENPSDTKKLAQDYQQARNKSPKKRTEDDLFTLMIANAVFLQDNSQYLSEEAAQVVKDEGVTFGGGDFGGSGAKSDWEPSTSHTQQHDFNQNHDIPTTHSHPDTTYHHDTGSNHYDSGPNIN